MAYDSIYVTNFWNKSWSKTLFKTGDSLKLEIDFQDVESNEDGSYGFVAYMGKDSIFKGFGYYTNGYPLAEWYGIEILNDTILITERIDK